MFHAKHADKYDPGNIVVRANDTDIAVILTCNESILKNSKLWYDSGLDSNNTRSYMDINMLSNTMANVKALPGIYAFTGNDYNAAFFRKGKTRPINLVNKKSRFIEAFESLGDVPLTEKF